MTADGSPPLPFAEATPHARSRSRLWTFLAWALLALLALLIVLYGRKCVRNGWRDPPGTDPATLGREKLRRGSDFTAYYSAGELARRGLDLYDFRPSSTPFRPYIYPPMFALFPMAPLSLLEHNHALIVFYVLNVALLAASLWLLRRLLWPPLGPPGGAGFQPACSAGFQAACSAGFQPAPALSFWQRPAVGLVLAVCAIGRFLDSNFVLSNANLYILFLLCLALYWLQRERGFLAGLAVALATCFKVTPGLFGLYLGWSRRAWAMVGGVVGLALFLVFVPSLVLGWNQNRQQLERYHAALGDVAAANAAPEAEQKPALAPEAPDDRPDVEGIALRGTLLKLLSRTISYERTIPGTDRKEAVSVNVCEWPIARTVWFSNVLCGVLLLATVILTLPRWTQQGPFAAGLSWGLVAVTMLLVSPLTRKAHCVVLLLPVAVLVALLQQNRLSRRARRAAWVGLLVLAGAGLLTSRNLIGDLPSGMAHSAGVFTWAMCALYAALALCLRDLRPPAPSPEAGHK